MHILFWVIMLLYAIISSIVLFYNLFIIPSIKSNHSRMTLAMEKKEWKPFRDALDKKERKEFDDMWDIPKLYISACSNSVQLVPLHPIFISILFHHYKELVKCKREVEFLGHKSIEIEAMNGVERGQIPQT
jgi:hypothetical protein